MSFQQALSGLNSASTSLNAIGNNLANTSTVGFKGAGVQFADAFAASMQGGGTSSVGIGSQIAGIAQQFTQGNLTTTNNPLDIAINGGGMFRMDNNGSVTYTRNGQFLLDKEGYIVNNQGLKLTGYAADATTGAIVPGNIVPLQIDNNAIPPVATALSQVQVNLDSRSKPPVSMTHGSISGSVNPVPAAVTVLAGTNDQFDMNVDGVAVTVTINPGVYNSAGLLSTEIERAANAALKAAGASTTSVTVSLDNLNQLVLTSGSVGTTGSLGNGSFVTLAAAGANTAYTDFFGTPVPSLAAKGFTTGSIVPALAGGNIFDIAIDGMTTPVTVTVTAGPYATPDALALQLETDINTALTGQGAVDVTADATTGFLTVTSRQTTVTSVGRTSQVTLTETVGPPAGTGVATLFGVPTTVAGGDMDNFSISNVNSYTASTAQTVYDTLGNPHKLSLYYVKTSLPAVWQFYTALDGDATSVNGPTQLTFSNSGVLQTPAVGTKLPQTFSVSTGAANPLVFDLDLAGTTQYGISFGTNQLIQDGYTSGKLSGMSVSADGIVQGRYSNGKSRNMGQLVLANFNNANGLQSLGNNQWAETSESGSPIPGGPGTGNLGVVQSGAVEESNVDMTVELVNMITAQRAYQANAQTIKTQDQIMQTLVNLR